LIVWNRSTEKADALRAAGARVAPSIDHVFAEASTVFLMLADEAAGNLVLGRQTADFESRTAGHTIIQMATTSPEYSSGLAEDIVAAGGRYVEAPVSGSRQPAEAGELVAMLAGSPDAVDYAMPLLAPMCRASFMCGAVPNALRMKLAVNLFLITMVGGLMEAFHFASRNGLSLNSLEAILEAGPMSSAVSRAKARKLLDADFSVQASITNVLENNRLIAQAARGSNTASPLLDVCHELFAEANRMGLSKLDMAAVIHAIEARSQHLAARPA
jgi:3-hydroxyisobutyrate dehydrogenase